MWPTVVRGCPNSSLAVRLVKICPGGRRACTTQLRSPHTGMTQSHLLYGSSPESPGIKTHPHPLRHVPLGESNGTKDRSSRTPGVATTLSPLPKLQRELVVRCHQKRLLGPRTYVSHHSIRILPTAGAGQAEASKSRATSSWACDSLCGGSALGQRFRDLSCPPGH